MTVTRQGEIERGRRRSRVSKGVIAALTGVALALNGVVAAAQDSQPPVTEEANGSLVIFKQLERNGKPLAGFLDGFEFKAVAASDDIELVDGGRAVTDSSGYATIGYIAKNTSAVSTLTVTEAEGQIESVSCVDYGGESFDQFEPAVNNNSFEVPAADGADVYCTVTNKASDTDYTYDQLGDGQLFIRKSLVNEAGKPVEGKLSDYKFTAVAESDGIDLISDGRAVTDHKGRALISYEAHDFERTSLTVTEKYGRIGSVKCRTYESGGSQPLLLRANIPTTMEEATSLSNGNDEYATVFAEEEFGYTDDESGEITVKDNSFTVPAGMNVRVDCLVVNVVPCPTCTPSTVTETTATPTTVTETTTKLTTVTETATTTTTAAPVTETKTVTETPVTTTVVEATPSTITVTETPITTVTVTPEKETETVTATPVITTVAEAPETTTVLSTVPGAAVTVTKTETVTETPGTATVTVTETLDPGVTTTTVTGEPVTVTETVTATTTPPAITETPDPVTVTETPDSVITTVTAVKMPNSSLKEGSSKDIVDERCLPAALGLGIPLLALIPLQLMKDLRIPGLDQFANQVNSEIAAANNDIQQRLGVFDENTARMVEEFNAQISRLQTENAEVIQAAGIIAALTAVAGYLAYFCVPRAETDNSSRTEPSSSKQ